MALSAVGRKVLLLAKHGTQRKIARRLDVEEARVSAVVNWTEGDDLPVTEAGWRSWRRIQRAVAKALGLSVEEAFTDVERGEVVEQEMSA